MIPPDTNPTNAKETISHILASVLLRRFTENKLESREQGTGIPPERMPNTQGHTNWRIP